MKKIFTVVSISILLSVHICKATETKSKVKKPIYFSLYKNNIKIFGAQGYLWILCTHFIKQKEIAYLLETEDVDINHINKLYESTLLMQVMQPGNIKERVQLMELLIEKGASVNPKVKGASPLHLACNLFIPEFITLLLKHGAKLDTKDCSLKTPIDHLNHHLVKKSQWHTLSKTEIDKQKKVREILIKLGFYIRD